jgi:ubiquinone/menaquinone biosynthesis C-methylase UbiE
MKLLLPEKKMLNTTSAVDYFQWNYKFPIKYIQKFRFKAILSLMGDQIYNRTLEVGTGSGIFLLELSRHTNELYAIDVHEQMDSVKSLCEKTGIKVKLLRSSIENTSFPDNFFDLILGVSVLEFVDDINKAIGEIKRILKPSGSFLTICPQEKKLVDFILNYYSRNPVKKEFGKKRSVVSKSLEKALVVKEKHFFPRVIGKYCPVYIYYKMSKL